MCGAQIEAYLITGQASIRLVLELSISIISQSLTTLTCRNAHAFNS